MSISLAHQNDQNESMDVILHPSATNAPLVFFSRKKGWIFKKKNAEPKQGTPHAP